MPLIKPIRTVASSSASSAKLLNFVLFLSVTSGPSRNTRSNRRHAIATTLRPQSRTACLRAQLSLGAQVPWRTKRSSQSFAQSKHCAHQQCYRYQSKLRPTELVFRILYCKRMRAYICRIRCRLSRGVLLRRRASRRVRQSVMSGGHREHRRRALPGTRGTAVHSSTLIEKAPTRRGAEHGSRRPRVCALAGGGRIDSERRRASGYWLLVVVVVAAGSVAVQSSGGAGWCGRQCVQRV